MTAVRSWLILSLTAFVILSTGCFWASSSTGFVNGRLKPCPPRPNCVSSVNGFNSDQHVRPIQTQYDLRTSRQAILRILRRKYSTEIVRTTPRYVHATVTTTLGFVDDMEFLFQPENNLIHVRSASRVGYSDLGTNRERIETIRSYFE